MIQAILKASDWLRHQARRRRLHPDHALGRRGEDLAHRFLEQSGYRVVARNFRLPDGAGEIDLIARQDDLVVFVEVKSRASDEFGAPERQMSPHKREHLKRAARVWARQAGVAWDRVRFDLVTVVFTQPPTITHLEDIRV